MTKAVFFRKDGKLVGAEVSGHVDMASEGEMYDVLCAAISSVIQTAVLGIMRVALINADVKIDDKTGYLSVMIPAKVSEREAHDADIILRTAYLGLSDLSEEYSDYITVEVE